MNLTIRKGTREDLPGYEALLETVSRGMEHSDWFYTDPPELLRQWYDRGQLEYWVAMDGDTLAGAFHILYPGLEPDNYGWDLRLSREELLRVIHMDSAAVDSRYRGRKLQRRLMQTIEEHLCREGREVILLTTVHPENLYSLFNVQSLGYTVAAHVGKYGSSRYILRKDISPEDNCL